MVEKNSFRFGDLIVFMKNKSPKTNNTIILGDSQP